MKLVCNLKRSNEDVLLSNKAKYFYYLEDTQRLRGQCSKRGAYLAKARCLAKPFPSYNRNSDISFGMKKKIILDAIK